jgi:hypothetical protein
MYVLKSCPNVVSTKNCTMSTTMELIIPIQNENSTGLLTELSRYSKVWLNLKGANSGQKEDLMMIFEHPCNKVCPRAPSSKERGWEQACLQ